MINICNMLLIMIIPATLAGCASPNTVGIMGSGFPVPLPGTYKFNISSTPSGADIYLNGDYKGKTPLVWTRTLLFQTVENYKIKVSLEDHNDGLVSGNNYAHKSSVTKKNASVFRWWGSNYRVDFNLPFDRKVIRRHWHEAQSLDSFQAYMRFLSKHPDSEFSQTARNQLYKMKANHAWKEAESADTVGTYEDFLLKYPDSQYSQVAEFQLFELKLNHAWKTAKTADTVRAYEAFLFEHPLANFSDSARSRMAVLRPHLLLWLELQNKTNEQAYRDFIAEHPDSPYVNKALMTIDDMHRRNIVDLLSEKKIEILIKGRDIQQVTVSIRKLVPDPIVVLIPVGSYFVSAEKSKQNMVTTADSKVKITNDDWKSISVAAACANQSRRIPRLNDSLTVQRSPHQKELERLMPVLDKANIDFPTKQAAVWIVTDNTSYSQLYALRRISLLQPQPTFFSRTPAGTRIINVYETARAMQLCEQAGIDITSKKIWYDKITILRGLRESELKSWLKER